MAAVRYSKLLRDCRWQVSTTFDAASRIAGVTSTDGMTTYSYDATGQFADADHSYQDDELYEYDLNGNRTLGPRYDDDIDVGTNNLLLSDRLHTYQYDDESNRTRKTTIATGDYVEYKWDHRNRLVAVEFRTSAGALTKTVEYDYDAPHLSMPVQTTIAAEHNHICAGVPQVPAPSAPQKPLFPRRPARYPPIPTP